MSRVLSSKNLQHIARLMWSTFVNAELHNLQFLRQFLNIKHKNILTFAWGFIHLLFKNEWNGDVVCVWTCVCMYICMCVLVNVVRVCECVPVGGECVGVTATRKSLFNSQILRWQLNELQPFFVNIVKLVALLNMTVPWTPLLRIYFLRQAWSYIRLHLTLFSIPSLVCPCSYHSSLSLFLPSWSWRCLRLYSSELNRFVS